MAGAGGGVGRPGTAAHLDVPLPSAPVSPSTPPSVTPSPSATSAVPAVSARAVTSVTQPVVAPAPGPGRLPALDGIRALAALWVLAHHAYLTVYPTGGPVAPGLAVRLLTGWLAYGHFAVVAFLVVSGYSLGIGAGRHGHRVPGGVRVFVRRRVRRVLVPYWAALAVSTVLATTVLGRRTGTHWDVALPVTTRGVVLHALVLQDVADPAQINHAMWSIAIEWHLYLLLPLLLAFRRRAGLAVATAVTVAASMVLARLWWPAGLTWRGETGLLGCFVLGLAAREIAARAPGLRPTLTPTVVPTLVPTRRGAGRGRGRPWGSGALVLAAAVALLAHGMGEYWVLDAGKAVSEPLAGAATACLLVAVTDGRPRAVTRLLSWRPLTLLGGFSYSLYLLHAPVLQLVWQEGLAPAGARLGSGWALAALVALGAVASVAVARVFFVLVERRCLTVRPPARARTGSDRPARATGVGGTW